MGWEPGKGLGAKEDGELNFIKIKYKNDIEGIGYEMRDDQWTQHENQFNKLLQNLSNPNSTANSSTANTDDEEDSADAVFVRGFKTNDTVVPTPPSSGKRGLSGISLEEKSKKSKTRVHYKKFTKGKDLAQYSEKDLANIFGKKSFEEHTFVAAPEFRLDREDEEEVEEKPDLSPKSSLQTTTSKISMTDYFQMKMKNIKRPERVMEETGGWIGGPPDEDDAPIVVAEETKATDTKKKKKKKRNKSKDKEEKPVEEISVVETSATVVENELDTPTRKKRARKELEDLVMMEFTEEPCPDEVKAEKKKKKKQKVNPVVDGDIETQSEKKKKNKRKNVEVEEMVITTIVEEAPPKKKKKKDKRKSEKSTEDIEEGEQ